MSDFPTMESDEPASKITEVAPQILTLLRRGCYLEPACLQAGITLRTLTNWRSWGAAGREPYATFLAEFESARAEAENVMLLDVADGVGNWQARAWVLERTRPERYRQKQTTEVEGSAEKPLWMRIAEEHGAEA